MITIVDYGLGNIKAFAHIYNALNIPFVIAASARELSTATRIILPGVGAFDQAMERLINSGMKQVLDEAALEKKVPVLGVCVGMQILMRSSEEGVAAGLGWIEGDVLHLRGHGRDGNIFVPHMGWNTVRPANVEGLFRGLSEQSEFYFLHSYVVRCSESQDILASANYGGEFACAVSHGNIYGVQFHPEKSHANGVQLLQNFAEL